MKTDLVKSKVVAGIVAVCLLLAIIIGGAAMYIGHIKGLPVAVPVAVLYLPSVILLLPAKMNGVIVACAMVVIVDAALLVSLGFVRTIGPLIAAWPVLFAVRRLFEIAAVAADGKRKGGLR